MVETRQAGHLALDLALVSDVDEPLIVREADCCGRVRLAGIEAAGSRMGLCPRQPPETATMQEQDGEPCMSRSEKQKAQDCFH